MIEMTTGQAAGPVEPVVALGKKCRGHACPNAASTLQCPTCLKLGVSTLWCGQDCFKRNWATHKTIHAILSGRGTQAPAINDDGTFDPFPNFNYTGPLRPRYPLSPRRPVPAHIVVPDYAQNGIPVSEQQVRGVLNYKVHSEEEIEGMRKVCRVLDLAASHVKPGITTDELDAIVHQACIDRESYPSPLNYHSFPKSVCTSVNEIICHGIPDKTVLKDGDIVNLDVTLYHQGFHGDLNATYAVGSISQDSKRVIETAKECLDKAIEIVKPGALLRDIGNTIEPIARGRNCQVIRTYCGHGINQLFHCLPNIPHYAKNKTPGQMKAGMIFTIEPMISLGTYRDVTWPDNWTSATFDGKHTAQFEETILVTDTGYEILTRPA